MTSPYDLDLDRNPANFQPLTPLTVLERAASVHPDHVAVIHGATRITYAGFTPARGGLPRCSSRTALAEATPFP